jgi:hypothetical protein
MGYLLEIAGRKFDGVACDFMDPVEDVLDLDFIIGMSGGGDQDSESVQAS